MRRTAQPTSPRQTTSVHWGGKLSEASMTATYDGERKWSALCLLGLHRWVQRNGSGQVRYQACRKCNVVNDAWTGAIGY